MNKSENIPADVYIRFVETLYRDDKTLAVGVATQSLFAIIVYWKTAEPLFLAVAIALLAGGIIRILRIWRIRLAPAPADAREARRRETEYIALACLHTFSLGGFCFIATYLRHDTYAELAAVSVTLASATAIAGRNYGSPQMVMILVLSLVGPIAAGFILHGDFYHIVLGIAIVPFVFAIRRYAQNVRGVLFSALQEQKNVQNLVARFDRALNTTPQGLLMFGPDGRVVVANNEAAHLLATDDAGQLVGRTLHSLMLRAVASGLITRSEGAYIERQLTQALHEGADRKLIASLSDGRSYEFGTRAGTEELGVVTFEDVTARVTAEEKIRFMAQYDNLTGLPNRGYFNDLVTDMLSQGSDDRLCGLAVFDLDDFKQINDSLGHPIGDGLIYAAADRLAAEVDVITRVGRFGGDEFIVFFNDLADAADLTRRMERIFQRFNANVEVAGHSLRLQASGGAVLAPAAGADVENLVVSADLALYEAKDDGKNQWRIFEAQMEAAFRARQKMKSDLRSAIDNGQIRVVYQPIVSLKSQLVASCEALCRWEHPELGPVCPSKFIPLAEEMGLVSSISAMVLEKACHACAQWPMHTHVSVNLSAYDFRSRDVVDMVRVTLERTGLAPQRLEIEITETALLNDKLLTVSVLNELKGLGVRIALDDFGTGYSSLSYLHALPLDKVKIDQAFLSDITFDDRSLGLLEGIMMIARRLGLAITLEGIENFEQLSMIMHLPPPDLLQGYLFGPAASQSEICALVHSDAPFETRFEAVGLSRSTIHTDQVQ